MNTPIYETLNEYLSRRPIRMHVPFHAGIPNNPILPKELYSLDISEVSGYDIEGEDNPIFRSEKITSDFFHVKHSFYLTGGASIGLVSCLMVLNKFGKKVILARNVHRSVINGLILSGLEPVWLDVDFLEEWGIFSSIDINKLANLVSTTSDIAGCVVVSPTYEGMISDISAISSICHRKNMPLIVDEAHGAHNFFLNKANLKSAIQLGADLVVQSWHKSLGSLTQSGVLHLVNDTFFTYNDIKRSIDLISSTSPSFLLLLSLELTREHLVSTKGEFFSGLYKNSKLFKEELKHLKELSCFSNDDPFRIYLKPMNLSGIDFAYELYKNYAIEVESVNDTAFLMLTGINFNENIKEQVVFALSKVSQNKKNSPLLSNKKIESLKPKPAELKIQPREAFLRGFKLHKDGYNCEVKAPCPPGYVIDVPGNKKCS